MSTTCLSYSLKETVIKLIESKNDGEIKQLIDELRCYFSEINEIGELANNVSNYASIPAKNGRALSVIHAAECFQDYKRTLALLRGLYQAINKKKRQFPEEKVHVFYAGAGPFAPFLNLMAPIFGVDELEFSILEINPDSLNCAKKLISELGYSDYVKNYYLEDAVTFKVYAPKSVDILFSETLDSLLFRESYVPIIMNLKEQMAKDVIVIPENVIISLTAASELNGNWEFNVLGEVFNVKQSLAELTLEQKKEEFWQCAIFQILPNMKLDKFILDTEVHVYDDIHIGKGESSITLSFDFEVKKPVTFNQLNFTYELYPTLELKCDFETVQ